MQKLSSAKLNVKNTIELDVKLKPPDLLRLQSHGRESSEASGLQKLSSASLNVKNTI